MLAPVEEDPVGLDENCAWGVLLAAAELVAVPQALPTVQLAACVESPTYLAAELTGVLISRKRR